MNGPVNGGWRFGPLLAFDTESTGVDTSVDRIVSACAALIPAANGVSPRTPKIYSYLANPGIEIPEAATAVHGITTQRAREHGADAADVVAKVTGLLRLALNEGIPIVGANIAYDLTLLDRESERYGIEPLAQTPDRLRPCIDSFVIDKAADPFRKGSRKLTALCELWKVNIEGAHDATVDALAAARVVYKMSRTQIPRAPSERPYNTPAIDIGAMSLDELHDAQVAWKAAQSKSFAKWLRGKATQERDPAEQERIRRDADAIRPEWPFIPRSVEPPVQQGALW